MEKKRVDHLLDMLSEDPKDSFLLYALALEYEKAGETQKAIAQLLTLTKEQPDYLATYYQLGQLLQLNNEFNKAKNYFEAGILLAQKQKNRKIEGELKEALSLLDDMLSD